MIKRAYKSSVILFSTKKYVAAGKIGLSTITYCKYLDICIKEGYAFKTNTGYQFKSLPFIFNTIFGDKQGKFIRVKRALTFQGHKVNIRAAIILANFRQQDFIILGDSSLEKTGKLTKKASFAKSWIKTKAPFRASGINKILTSSRQAGNIISMCHQTANKALFKLLQQKEVMYSYQSSIINFEGNTRAKIAFAEVNRPFQNCRYTLFNRGIRYFTGREVILTSTLFK